MFPGGAIPLLVLLGFTCPTLLVFIYGNGKGDEMSKQDAQRSKEDTHIALEDIAKSTTDIILATLTFNSTSTKDVQTAIDHLSQLQHLNLPRDERRSQTNQLVDALQTSKANSFIALKGKVNQKTAQQIIDDCSHTGSYINRLNDAVADLTTFTKNELSERFLSRVALITMSYFDLIKDLILVTSMVWLRTPNDLFNNCTEFPNVVTWLLITSVALPLIVSGITTSHKFPLVVFDFEAWKNYKKFSQNTGKMTSIPEEGHHDY